MKINMNFTIKRKNKQIRIKIKERTLQSGITLWYCDKKTAKKWADETEELSNTSNVFKGNGRCVTFDAGLNPIVWVDNTMPTIEIIGILSHELIHATHGILHQRGIKYDYDDGEVVAYLHEFLLTESLRYLKFL